MLMGLDEKGITDAIGIAASMGAGLLEANRTGGTVKRMHCGWAAHSGVVAARAGPDTASPGRPTVIEGRFGFLHAFCGDRADVDAVVDGPGRALGAARHLLQALPLQPLHPRGHRRRPAAARRRRHARRTSSRSSSAPRPPCCAPSPSRRRPRPDRSPATTRPSAVPSPSLPRSSAAAGLGVGHEDFTDEAARDETPAGPGREGPLRRRTPAATRSSPTSSRRSCGSTLSDGTQREVRVDVNRGGPGNPLSADELAAEVPDQRRAHASTRTRRREVADAAYALPSGGLADGADEPGRLMPDGRRGDADHERASAPGPARPASRPLQRTTSYAADAPHRVRERVRDLVVDTLAVTAWGSRRRRARRAPGRCADGEQPGARNGPRHAHAPRPALAGSLNGAAAAADQLQDGHRDWHVAIRPLTWCSLSSPWPRHTTAPPSRLLSAVLAGYEVGRQGRHRHGRNSTGRPRHRHLGRRRDSGGDDPPAHPR